MPTRTLVDPNGKVAGNWIQERGLTYAIINEAGHSIPTDSPAMSFLALQVMLGRRTFAEGESAQKH